MSTLRIFDVSVFISAGSEKPSNFLTIGICNTSTGYKARTMACGGIASILTAINEFIGEEDTDFAFCCDRIPTIKRALHSKIFPNGKGYKGGRRRKSMEVLVQRKYVETILERMGFNVIFRDDYEADDCIATLVRDYKDYYDQIYIHTKDSDMAHLVCENVSVVPLIKEGKTINMHNYYDNVSSKDYTVYNCVTLNKILYGESGDTIKSVGETWRNKILKFIPKSEYPKLGDCRYLRSLIAQACDNDEYVMGVTDLIIPLEMPQGEIELYELDFNRNAFVYYSVMLGCFHARNFESDEQPTDYEILDAMLDEFTGGA